MELISSGEIWYNEKFLWYNEKLPHLIFLSRLLLQVFVYHLHKVYIAIGNRSSFKKTLGIFSIDRVAFNRHKNTVFVLFFFITNLSWMQLGVKREWNQFKNVKTFCILLKLMTVQFLSPWHVPCSIVSKK